MLLNIVYIKDYINVSWFFPPLLVYKPEIGASHAGKKLVVFGLLLSGSASGGKNT